METCRCDEKESGLILNWIRLAFKNPCGPRWFTPLAPSNNVRIVSLSFVLPNASTISVFEAAGGFDGDSNDTHSVCFSFSLSKVFKSRETLLGATYILIASLMI